MGVIVGAGRGDLAEGRGRAPARWAAALLILLGLAGGLLAAGAGSASAQPLARGRGFPTGEGGHLYGIHCTSAANCWAVGDTGANLTEALHWNGQEWSQAATPSPGDYYDTLYAVDCTSAASCWAVGTAAYSATFKAPNLALHWDGHTWSQVPTPSPYTGQGFNELLSVTCISAADCWAVGADSLGGQALHWDGHRWSVAAVPSNTGPLSEAQCTSSANCWAVGIGRGNQALHWNGHTWSQVATPAPGTMSELNGIGCTSAVSCWAVGGYGDGRVYRSEALHWNGRQWSQAPTPKPRGTVNDPRGLGDLTCTSAANCWAVGPADFPLGSVVNEALHWDGRTWSYVTMPSPALGQDPTLRAVACTSAANCWAVGSDARGNQALHWNGHQWSTA